MADKHADKPGKKPFVSQADRPEVRLKSDTPISDLTVRDLATIFGQLGTGKDFWDGKDWQKDDFDGQNKPWKEGKEGKEGKESKDGKEVKDKETKEFKDGKEKREIKELKAEKLELDGVFDLQSQPDPRIEQVIRALSGMSAKVDQLADQIEALKKGKG
jgi:hypothetical protein